MDRLKFDTANPDLAVVRQVMLQRLRAETDWKHVDQNGRGFLKYVELSPPRPNDLDDFAFLAMEVFWMLMIEGVLAPGFNASNPNLPFFHVTTYGRTALASDDYVPHDRTGYLARLRARVVDADDTVMTYLDESLETFVRGNLVASTVMLGVAAERVFNLLGDSLVRALKDPAERVEFGKVLDRFAMKPKVDWVHAKLLQLQDQRPRLVGLPENSALMLTAIYDMIRSQRNDLGHPRETPPRLTRGDAHANLEIFPRYYESAEAVRRFLSSQQV